MSRRQKREARQAHTDMAEMLRSPAARRFLLRLLDACGVFTLNPALDGRAEGRREIGVWLVRHMNEVKQTAFAELQIESIRRALDEPDEGDDDDN
jgi:hypothetical protein